MWLIICREVGALGMGDGYVSRDEYNKDIKRIDGTAEKQAEQIQENTNDITAIKTIWANIAKMPEQINNIEKAQIETRLSIERDKKETLAKIDTIQTSINGLAKYNGKQDEKIEKSEKRGTVDIIKLITDNAWKIAVLIAALAYIVAETIGVKIF